MYAVFVVREGGTQRGCVSVVGWRHQDSCLGLFSSVEME